MIYHLLTESEPFSEHFGGALSRWTANVLRNDQDSMIACPWADDSWNFPSRRIIALEGLEAYERFASFFRRHALGPFRPFLLSRVLSPLMEKLREGDVLYIHNRPEHALALQTRCRRIGVRLILHMQNSHLTYFSKRALSRLNLDAFVFCSSFLKSEATGSGVSPANAKVIPNGADEDLFFPATDRKSAGAGSSPVVLFVGRLVPEKGAHLFLAAMKSLQEKGIQVLGKLIGATGFGSSGKSSYFDQLERDKPANVEFGEYVSGRELADQYRSASLFCCPSIWNEPFGMVNVEAMATGLPVVASAVGGIPEIFERGGGLLVPPNRVEELANAIELLITDAGRRAQLSHEALRSFQTRYRWQSIRSQYHALVNSLGYAA
jgi:spore coat protein SA